MSILFKKFFKYFLRNFSPSFKCFFIITGGFEKSYRNLQFFIFIFSVKV
ncbi:hypothetical protein HMPREF3229_00124 [Peptoniphilus harei]|uniref:Uncharacterized protein n=1 Tax=Peptoniphilus harei TaxID=54005 RepID=A0A133PSF3_9FIRM|nr:hypothetical protein HMPREF3229_00124 [Peptoniphilus harei]